MSRERLFTAMRESLPWELGPRDRLSPRNGEMT